MKKHIKVILPVALLLVLIAVGYLWIMDGHIWLNGKLFPFSASEVVLSGDKLPDMEALKQMEQLQTLDVRNIPITPESYERLRSVFPDCRILWKVPVFDGNYDNTETELAITAISEQDIETVRYIPDLKKIDATGCRSYALLMDLHKTYPGIDVTYTVDIDGQALRENITEITFSAEDASELLAAVPYFPDLQKVDALACTDYSTLCQLKIDYPELEVQYTVPVCGEDRPGDTTHLTVHNANGDELRQVLPYFPDLTDVTLTGATPDNEAIYEMVRQYPDVIFHWEFSVHGVTTSSTATELILSNIEMETVEEVESALKYFYHLERVEMCECGISSEEMDALGKRHPEIRFVWSIPMGKGYLRTDATAFIPYLFGYDFKGPCSDEQTSQLKYCPDLVCLDLGHMRMKDLSFLHYMPNLKYLILADTEATDYSPVAELSELIFLELFNSKFTDTELLLSLTKLEDLNISWASLKQPQLLKQMTWLKRLWATRVGLTDGENRELKEALPDTQVYVNGLHPTEGGWRQSQNYYDMRDLLGMPYME